MSNAMQQLIREQLELHGWSYGDVARRGGLPRSTVHHLATADRMVRMPQPATLEGLAKGLGLAPETVRRAAAEACGIQVYADAGPAADPEVSTLIASLKQLSPEDRRHVTALVDSLLRGGRPTGGDPAGGDSAGGDPAGD